MNHYRYVILGAGPAGLSFANALKQRGEDSFFVFEKEMQAGGLCRSREVDGAPLDIGGGHFLDVRRPGVNQFLFQFMPECEWERFERDSRIAVDGVVIGHPFEANIWQMPQELQVSYLKSIAVAGVNLGLPMPERFREWICWKLGEKIAEHYMLPYNMKMFGAELDELGTYWLEKLPDVSFDETLFSCLNRKPYGTQPGHAQFFYPKKYGYGELWLRMAEEIGTHIRYGVRIQKMNMEETSITLSDGSVIKGDYIISTIPWTSIPEYAGVSEQLLCGIHSLKHTSVHITYFPEKLDTKAQWIYYPDLELSYHRILVRSNFCANARGYWTETNSERYRDEGRVSFGNEYAYPLNTLTKPKTMQYLLDFCRRKNIIGLGRWGEWEHYNSDVTVERALKLAEELAG